MLGTRSAAMSQSRLLGATQRGGARAVSARAGSDSTSVTKSKYTLKSDGSPFTVGKGQLLPVASASLGLLLRAGTGALVAGYKAGVKDKSDDEYGLGAAGKVVNETSAVANFNRPKEPLIMYEFDACPFCKKVREMCSYLDVDCVYKPCPQGSTTFRPEATEKSGKSMFPYMVDPNTGTAMNESDDIIKYLADTYGDGTVPLMLRLGIITALTAGFSALPRIGKGGRKRPAKMPEQPLVVWGYEPSPFVRLVKEELCELELPHLFKTCARGSPKRQEMFDAYGKFQVPLLEDPNTGVALFESAEIVKYLEETYAEGGAAAATA